MSQDVREVRCAEVAEAVIHIIPALLEGKAKPPRLQDALAGIRRIQEVARAGDAGITDESYLAWLRVAPENLAAVERALLDENADLAFSLFRDSATGVQLLTAGCEGCQGW